MKAEKPAQSISCTGVWDDARSFRIGCDCHDADHDVNMWIETKTDKEIDQVEVGFYVEGTSPYWSQGWNRFRAAWEILLLGYHRSEHHLLLGKQAAINLAAAIQDTVKNLEENSNKTSKL